LSSLSWGGNGVIGATEAPFTAEKESAAYQKKIKRWTKDDFGTLWRFYWQVILNECWKARRKIVMQRNLFKLEPRGPNPTHRRRNDAVWNTIFDLRNYFIKIDGTPHMRLLGRLLCPNQQEVTFNGEWQDRKAWFTNENGAERLEKLQRFYTHNRVRILETLRTRIPFYAKWESGHIANRAV
jgi:hypothetical protein